jgi:spermidine synthase
MVAGLLALTLGRQRGEPGPEPATASTTSAVGPDKAHHVFALAAALATGAIGLAYEVAWMRLLSVYTLNSVYVFSMVVSLYLAALTVGTALSGLLIRRSRLAHADLLAVVQVLLAFLTPLMLYLLPSLADVGIANAGLSDGDVFIREFLLSAGIVFVPTVFIGMTLPLLVAMFRSPLADAGLSVGRIYAWNSVGTILGAALTGVALVPLVGLRGTLLLLAACNFLIGGWATLLQPALTQVRRALPVVSAAAMVFLVVLLPPTLRFYRKMPGDLEERVVYYAEGPSATVHVTEVRGASRPYLQLYVDSQGVAGTYPEIVIDQKMPGHLPLLIHPDPQRSLTVGFGTGGSSYSATLHGIFVDVVEIEPRVPDSAPLFVSENHGRVGPGPLRGKFELIIDDARAWLQVTPRAYDSIMTDMTSIQYRGNGNLYTTNFFELMKSRLAEDGLGCAWVPIDGVTPEQFKILTRSFRKVFPHTSIWYMLNLPTDFVFLVGTPGPLSIDLAGVAQRMQRPLVARDLAEIDLVNPYQFLACLLLADDDVAAYLGEGRIHTDDMPILDYLTHASRYQRTIDINLAEMLAHRSDPGQYVTRWPEETYAGLPEGIGADGTPKAWRSWNQAAIALIQGHIHATGTDEDSWDQAREAYAGAAELLPGDELIAGLTGS